MKKKKEKKKKTERKINNHIQERTPRIYVVRPLAYIHGRRQGESVTNKYGEYKGGVEPLTNPNRNTPK